MSFEKQFLTLMKSAYQVSLLWFVLFVSYQRNLCLPQRLWRFSFPTSSVCLCLGLWSASSLFLHVVWGNGSWQKLTDPRCRCILSVYSMALYSLHVSFTSWVSLNHFIQSSDSSQAHYGVGFWDLIIPILQIKKPRLEDCHLRTPSQ